MRPSSDDDECFTDNSSWIAIGPEEFWESGRSSPVHHFTTLPEEYHTYRARIANVFTRISQTSSSSLKLLPSQTGDSLRVNDDDDSEAENFMSTLANCRLHDIGTLKEILELQFDDEPWDDRKYLLEDIIDLCSRLPPKSKASRRLTDKIIQQFWNDLSHPPLSFVPSAYDTPSIDNGAAGSLLPRVGRVNLHYRSVDGSYNNVYSPFVGAANQPYARSVPPATPQIGVLPDAGLVFDRLLKRDRPAKHPNGISSMLFYLATIIIHDLFRTSHKDPGISETSSYLDLSPLYGSNQTEQDQVRTKQAGKLSPDCFADKRVLGFPPGVSVLLIMFNRFHNTVVEKLAAINEGNRFDPNSKTLDEDLFQTARLIVCGLYVNIVLNDYIRTIINLVQTSSNWKLDPRVDVRGGSPRGVGNQVSAEFNLIYRWHAFVSERDETWINKIYEKRFGRSLVGLSVPELMRLLGAMEDRTPDEPKKRHIFSYNGDKLTRDQSGNFDNDQLVEIVRESVEDQANAFGAHQVPECLRVVEIMGMEQARRWQVCTLNEFRKFFNLAEYKSFEEINEDVADDLRGLYETPDQVELYPGLACEQTKQRMSPGSGLMPGFTISRAILSDATALVRGDRFHTIDFHPKALTNWGYAEVESDPHLDHGCCFYKLMLNAFPNHFKRNSVYAHFPFMIPSEMKTILDREESRASAKHARYNFDPPSTKASTLIEVNTFDGALRVLKQPRCFVLDWKDSIAAFMNVEAKHFRLVGDDAANTQSTSILAPTLNGLDEAQHDIWKRQIKRFYLSTTRDLLTLKANVHDCGTLKRADLIQDVTNMASVYFWAEVFALPLQSSKHTHGIFTEHQLHLVFTAIYMCISYDNDTEYFRFLTEAREAVHVLGEVMESSVSSMRETGVLAGLMRSILDFNRGNETSPLQALGMEMIKRLLRVDKVDVKELVYGYILCPLAVMVAKQGQHFAELLAFYLLDEEGKKHWPDIVKIAREDLDGDDPSNEEKMMRYVMEGSRLACTSSSTLAVNGEQTIILSERRDDPPLKYDYTRWCKKAPGSTFVSLKSGDKVSIDLQTASRDPMKYVAPDKVSLNRDLENDYICFSGSPPALMDVDVLQLSLSAMLRVVAQLPHLQPETGHRMKTVPSCLGSDSAFTKARKSYMTKCLTSYWPLPVSLRIQWKDKWDEPSPLQVKDSRSCGDVNTANEHAIKGDLKGFVCAHKKARMCGSADGTTSRGKNIDSHKAQTSASSSLKTSLLRGSR